MNNTKERLKYFIEKQGISGRKFSEKISASPNYFNVTKTIGSDMLEKIHSAYPEINMDWVITGRGEMLCHVDLPIPNYFIGNLWFFSRTYSEYENDFAKQVGLKLERIKGIIQHIILPSMDDVKRVANGVNIPVNDLLYQNFETSERFRVNIPMVAEPPIEYNIDWKKRYEELQERLIHIINTEDSKHKSTG